MAAAPPAAAPAAEAAGPGTGSRRLRRGPLRRAAGESILLLLSPLLVVWPLRAQLWATTNWIDPFLHTAVIQHGRDLLDRFGADNRQFARAGVAVPGRLFNLTFGDLGGYLAFRYFLALVSVVPAYLLFRRLNGPAAGAVAGLAVLANPVVLLAWGSDYGDSAAVAYLTAGTCCLVMPTSSPARRLGWLAVAGVALALALHSIFITVPLIGALVLADAVLTVRRDRREAMIHLAVLAAALVVTTGMLMLVSKLLYGVADILAPTWNAYRQLRTPDQVSRWHTASAGWALEDPHLLVPPAVIAGWAAVRCRRCVPVAEITVVLAAALQVAAYAYLQFLNTEQTLEFYLYLSLLWPGLVLASAFLVVAVARPLLDSARTAVVPAALVLLVPLAVHPFREQLVFRIPWTGLLIAAGLVVIAAVARWSGRARRWSGGPLVLCAALLVGSYVLLTGKDTGKPWALGQVRYPPPHYAAVIDTPYGQERDQYAVASQLHHVVPAPRRPGTPLLLWWPSAAVPAVEITAAQYGWNRNAVDRSVPMPNLTPGVLQQIRQRTPDHVVMLSPTGHEFGTAVIALARGGLDPSIVRSTTLQHGAVTVFVQVVQVAPRSQPYH